MKETGYSGVLIAPESRKTRKGACGRPFILRNVLLDTELAQKLWPKLEGEIEARLPGMISDIDRALSDESIEPDDTWYLRIKNALESE